MNIEEAYQVLKIDLYSNEERIKKAYQELSKEYHPDISDGQSDEQASINEAYNIVLDFQKAKSLIVLPAAIENSLIKLNQNFELAQFKEETRNFLNSVVNKNSNRNKSYSYSFWFIAAILGIMGFASKEIAPLFDLPIFVQTTAKISAVLCGFYALIFQFLRENIKNKIEDVAEKFQNKQYTAGELAHLLNYKNVEAFDAGIFLTGGIEERPHIMGIFLGRLSSFERNKMFILKAKENGLIIPLESAIITPQTINMYKLKFNPQDFKPQENVDA